METFPDGVPSRSLSSGPVLHRPQRHEGASITFIMARAIWKRAKHVRKDNLKTKLAFESKDFTVKKIHLSAKGAFLRKLQVSRVFAGDYV